MKRRPSSFGFREQLRRSMDDLRSIMARGQSPGGSGRFTVRTVEIVEPGVYDAAAIRRLRRSLQLSQALFAQLLGVSVALVRAWELGARSPAPIARRLLDQVRSDPRSFVALVRHPMLRETRATRAAASTQKVA